MAKRMLVDATQPEETRVVVVNGNRLEELDFEIASKKQLKGNIYLAKVTRVEPSLQAAFVEYGGNRHGFLAFSEVHPDYYRIPVADREALLAEERRYSEYADADGDGEGDAETETAVEAAREPVGSGPEREANGAGDAASEVDSTESVRASYEPVAVMAETLVVDLVSAGPSDEAAAAGSVRDDSSSDTGYDGDAGDAGYDGDAGNGASGDIGQGQDQAEDHGQDQDQGEDHDHGHDAGVAVAVEAANFDVVGGDEVEEMVRRRPRPLRSYKIQEVIKRRQILLVQVTKEERGTKGAALTTYLSLPGRYCVLMPNTGRGGGISRKITNPQDRKRLKEMLSDLDVPQGMAVILRTAGLERSKPEIKRDLEYLLRLWDSIREQTLKSTAPELIYEEANLIKRSIRDLYTNDIDEVHVEGEHGYRVAKDFMRMLVPSHTKRVQPYRDDAIPLFVRYQVETQIDAIHSPVVQLKSGGYIVINPTEALVAIDVNSGRSTRERNIEETAFKTNLEAADEIGRQLRLRDLAGLIVIDFIDMEDSRNNVSVERRLKEAMKTDRARIQLGRISPFGLLELSRQRLRPSLMETNFERCPHCQGAGVIRSVESASLHTLRALEEEGIRRRSAEITVAVASKVALYILNSKRTELARIEQRYGMRVQVLADDSLIIPDLRIERVRTRGPGDELIPVITAEKIYGEAERATGADLEDEEVEVAAEDEEEVDSRPGVERVAPAAEGGADDGRGRRGGRRSRRGRRRPGGPERVGEASAAEPLSAVAAFGSVRGERAAAGDGGEVTEAGAGAGEVGVGVRDVGVGARDVGVGARDVGVGARDVGVGARDVGVGARDVGVGARDVGVGEGAPTAEGDGQPRKRRRGKRGGRRRGRGRLEPGSAEAAAAQASGEEPQDDTTDENFAAGDLESGFDAEDEDGGDETDGDESEGEESGGDESRGLGPIVPVRVVPGVVTDAAGQVDDVGDFDWFLDGERATAAAGVQTAGALAAVEVTEVAAPGDSIEVAVASTEGDGAAVSLADSLDAVEPAGLGDADSGEAAVTGGESATAVDAVAAEEAGPRRRTRRRAGSDESGDSEATAVRRTRRRVKLAEAGETAVVLEVAAEVAPEAAAEIMPEPVPEPVPESVPESVVDSLIVVESAGEAAEVASLDDGAAIAPTERLDEVPPAAPVIVVDAPLPAPTRESVDDGVAPIDSRPARRGWWSRA